MKIQAILIIAFLLFTSTLAFRAKSRTHAKEEVDNWWDAGNDYDNCDVLPLMAHLPQTVEFICSEYELNGCCIYCQEDPDEFNCPS